VKYNIYILLHACSASAITPFLGGEGICQLPSFEVKIFYPAKTANSIFPSKGQRNVGRIGGQDCGSQNQQELEVSWTSLAPGFSNKDFQPLVLSSPSLTTSKMMPRWTTNRYLHVSLYSWHTIYTWHTCTCTHTHVHTYVHLYTYIHIYI